MGDIINIYGYMRVSSKEQNEDRQKSRQLWILRSQHMALI